MKLYDISLRGTRPGRTGLSVTDRLVAARRLDALGVTFVDGGRPGRWFYARAAIELRLRAATLIASGRPEDLTALLAAETPAVAIVVQGHGFSILREAVRQLVRAERRVIVEARDFFDGWLIDPEHALEVVLTAAEAGAETVLLHDTAGALWPDQVGEIVESVAETGVPLGFGCPDDGGSAAKQLFAADAGAGLVQGSYVVVRGGLDRAVSPSVHSAETGIAPVPCPRLEQTVSAQKAIGGVR
jgi:isopropylmalate/homocitrate/citramalate synthase